jgi:hypothetical protein
VRIALVSVTVNNPNEAFKFYAGTLGFVEKIYKPEMFLAIVASPDDPDGTGILLEPNNHPLVKTFQQGVYNFTTWGFPSSSSGSMTSRRSTNG